MSSMRKSLTVLAVCCVCVVLLTTGCKKKDKDPIIIGPNWAFWDNPAAPDSLDVSDPYGDEPLIYGDEADWFLMLGTYDARFVYLWVDVFGDIDQTGDLIYSITLDMDNSGTLNSGDYLLVYSGTSGFVVSDFTGNPVSIGAYFRLDIVDGGIDFAIPRSLFSDIPFGVMALVQEGLDVGDVMPDSGFSTFLF